MIALRKQTFVAVINVNVLKRLILCREIIICLLPNDKNAFQSFTYPTNDCLESNAKFAVMSKKLVKIDL